MKVFSQSDIAMLWSQSGVAGLTDSADFSVRDDGGVRDSCGIRKL